MICLDTNVVIGLLNRRSTILRRRFESCGQQCCMSVLVLFELQYGIAKSSRTSESAGKLEAFLQTPVAVLPFEREDAAEAGLIRAALEAAGTPIGPYDTLIAAQARRRGAKLVTANTREFARVPGLVLEDWTREAGA